MYVIAIYSCHIMLIAAALLFVYCRKDLQWEKHEGVYFLPIVIHILYKISFFIKLVVELL